MYCVNCGVKLADTETSCPLCQTAAYHPAFTPGTAAPTYPRHKHPEKSPRSLGPAILMTALFVIPLLAVLACDIRFNLTVTWSGYVIGALLMIYVMLGLPLWFRHPNPVIFVPCSFVAIALYLLYIDLTTGGQWFLSFAFPVTGAIGIIVTAVTTLLRYLKKGKLYIIGGAFVALGSFMPLMEFLLHYTFHDEFFIGWSIYPLTCLVLFGGMLIFLAICRPAREVMERKFFI